MTFVSVDSVRIAGGFPSDLITDADIESALRVVQEVSERSLNTTFSPIRRLDVMDGTNSYFFYTLKNPVLRLDYLSSNDDEIPVEDCFVERESGRVSLVREASTNTFFPVPNGIKVEYWSAFLIPDRTFTVLSSPATSGFGSVLSVDDVGLFDAGDWLELRSRSGLYTSALVQGIVGTDVTVDNLVFDLPAGTTVSLLRLPEYLKRFIELEAVIYLSLNAIGATYVFNASYSLGDLSVTKGVPYTHWRESLEKAIKERNNLRGIVKPRFKIL